MAQRKATIRLVRSPKPALVQQREYRKEVRKDFNKNGDSALKAYNRVVANWSASSKPKFAVQVVVTVVKVGIVITVTEANSSRPIWKWINQTGTKAHRIKPKKPGGILSFVWGGPGSYRPKTSPSPARFGGPGKVFGGVRVYLRFVQHPGFRPRLFSVVINKELTKDQTRRLQNAKKRHMRKVTR